MKTLEDQLASYAAYHRDSRNIATHFVGIPMIVVAVAVLLSRPVLEVAGFPLSPAVVVVALLALYYLRLSLGLGLLMTALLALAVWFGAWVAGLPRSTWLGVGVGGFVVGWVFQFVGHYWEGRKPAFVDDLTGLAIGPLFVVTEAIFMAGRLPELMHAVEARAGKVRRGGAHVTH
nr:Mpo1-like protein [Dyella sp. ASV24]